MSGISDSYDTIATERAIEARRIDKIRDDALLVAINNLQDTIVGREVQGKVPQRFIDSLSDFSNYVYRSSKR